MRRSDVGLIAFVLAWLLALAAALSAQTVTAPATAAHGSSFDLALAGPPTHPWRLELVAVSPAGVTVWAVQGLPGLVSASEGTFDASGTAVVTAHVPDAATLVGWRVHAVLLVVGASAASEPAPVLLSPVAAVGIVASGEASQPPATGPPAGFSDLPVQAGARIVYVSAAGQDSAGGLLPSTPVRTLARGRSLLRDGHPDRLRIRRGDTFREPLSWDLSGAGPGAPMVLETFGSGPRPRILSGDRTAFSVASPVRHLAVVGLHFELDTYAGTTDSAGVKWRGAGEGILFEDCVFAAGLQGVALNAALVDVRLNRCIVYGQWHPTAHAQGIYASKVQGLQITECLIDDVGTRHPSMFKHNAYVQVDCSEVVARGNTFARASATGIQMRTGGACEGNLFYRCPIALTFGPVDGTQSPVPGGVSGKVADNVVLEGNDTGTSPRGFGFEIGNINAHGVEIAGNILSRDASAQPWGKAINLQGGTGVGVQGVTMTGNIAWRWRGGLWLQGKDRLHGEVRANVFHAPGSLAAQLWFHPPAPGLAMADNVFDGQIKVTGVGFIDAAALGQTITAFVPSFPEPDRTLDGYAQTLGLPNAAAWLQACRDRAPGTWMEAFSAEGASAYIRGGFGRRLELGRR